MKKAITKAAAFIAAIISAASCSLAADSHSWYCVRKKDHARPECDSSMTFISDHSGYYIGKNPDEKVIFLTFDAGYDNGNIGKILDVLKKHGATGAFFVLKNLIEKNTDLVRRMNDEGHLVCNHTSRHRDMSKMTDAEFEAELRSLENIAAENGVTLAKFYRPPEGRFSEENLACAEKMGYSTVFWSLAYADWNNNKQPNPESAKKLLFDNTHSGAVVLLHPTSKTNADILDDLLTGWESEGYRFGTLYELTEK